MGIVSLAAADAYKEKQAAYDQFNAIRKEMQELNVELQERYAEIGMLQKLYDDVHTRSKVEWEAHKQALTDFDERITNTFCGNVHKLAIKSTWFNDELWQKDFIGPGLVVQVESCPKFLVFPFLDASEIS